MEMPKWHGKEKGMQNGKEHEERDMKNFNFNFKLYFTDQ